jgi:iron complex outermembrane receptor protein
VFNAVALQTQPVNPENIKAYEIGTKNSLGDLSLNVAGFYYDYADLQVGNLVKSGPSYIQIVNNAAKSKIYGAEVDSAWHATSELDLNLGISYLHARYSSFPSASVIVPAGVSSDPSNLCNWQAITPSNQGLQTTACDVSGKTLIRSPDFTTNLSAIYDIPSTVGPFSLSGTVYYTTKIFYDALNRVEQPAYALLNARIGWRPVQVKDLEVSLYGRNLTDRHVIASVFESETEDFTRADNPRTYGVQLSYGF